MDEVGADFVWWNQGFRANLVSDRGREREAAGKIRIGAGTAFAVFNGIVEICQKFKPPLDAGVVLTNLGDILKGFVVGVDVELVRL